MDKMGKSTMAHGKYTGNVDVTKNTSTMAPAKVQTQVGKDTREDNLVTQKNMTYPDV